MKNGWKLSLLIIGSAMLLTACDNGKTETRNDVVRDNESTIEEESKLPEYAFAIEGYAEIQEGEIENINAKDYLPNEDMTLTYEYTLSEDAPLQYYYNIYPEEEGRVRYEGESPGDVLLNFDDDNVSTSTGYYYYDTEADCLAEVSTNILTGKEQDVAYLIPMGKSLNLKKDVKIQNVSYLFTVTCEAGIYKDCVAVINTDTSTDTETATITYYAKGIGEILTVTNFPNGGTDFSITNILVEVESIGAEEISSTYQPEKSDAETQFDIEDESTTNNVNYFYDGQRFECFETKSGEDMILTIRLFYDSDENGNMISDMPSMYKGVLNNGIEFWFEYYESTSEYIIYEVNCADGSTAYLKYNLFTSEIELFTDDGFLNDCGGSYDSLGD